jgi:hypothetical protein
MPKSRNHDSIIVVESRLDLDHGIIGHVASDQNFADLGQRSIVSKIAKYEIVKEPYA